MSGPFGTDPRALAAVELVGRTGAASFQIRFHDDEEPTVFEEWWTEELLDRVGASSFAENTGSDKQAPASTREAG